MMGFKMAEPGLVLSLGGCRTTLRRLAGSRGSAINCMRAPPPGRRPSSHLHVVPLSHRLSHLSHLSLSPSLNRLFNADTYEPKTARARRKGVCPRCDAVVPPAEQTHKSGWCTPCQKNHALVDFSDGF
jgi:hypothetical protein